ncbi:MAG: rRNA maturation RNase YbeY [Cardiobacteriaceae bacterium]|nr:rRNA maturation RNase YbeY [Cardiobacteriaceae bacterium]
MLSLDYQTEDYQQSDKALWFPSPEQIEHWLQSALGFFEESDYAVTVRLVEDSEMQTLNHTYRGKDYATNILSFPFEADFDEEVQSALGAEILGDMVIAVSVVHREALEQKKAVEHHFAHLCVHGLLHLLGYDHIEEEEALEMEQLEREILATLGIQDPYQEESS